MNVPRKYWWLVSIVVPLAVAVIGTIGYLIPKGHANDTMYINVGGTQFNGKVAFDNVSVVQQQAEQALHKDIPPDILDDLQRALHLAQSKEFNKAIPVFQSVSKAVPVPAVFNNLGAAYLATGNHTKAESYFEKAKAMMPNAETVHYNLEQLQTDFRAPFSADEKFSSSTSDRQPTTPPQLTQNSPVTLVPPRRGGYSSVLLSTYSVMDVRYTITVNDLIVGIYQFDKNGKDALKLDRFLKPGAQNTISFQFEEATSIGPSLSLWVKFSNEKEWFEIYSFKATKKRLKDTIVIPFTGNHK